MTKRFALIATGLGILAILGLAATSWLRGGDRHGDGAGPLGSYGVPGTEGVKVDPTASGGASWTFGVRLCLLSGVAPAILESVVPTKTVGSGFRAVGTAVRRFTPSPADQPIISTHPWPPSTAFVPDAIRDVQGFAVTSPCSDGATDPYTELLVGLALVGVDGGGWQGLEITYRVDGRRHVLVLGRDLMICGTSVDCSAPPHS